MIKKLSYVFVLASVFINGAYGMDCNGYKPSDDYSEICNSPRLPAELRTQGVQDKRAEALYYDKVAKGFSMLQSTLREEKSDTVLYADVKQRNNPVVKLIRQLLEKLKLDEKASGAKIGALNKKTKLNLLQRAKNAMFYDFKATEAGEICKLQRDHEKIAGTGWIAITEQSTGDEVFNCLYDYDHPVYYTSVNRFYHEPSNLYVYLHMSKNGDKVINIIPILLGKCVNNGYKAYIAFKTLYSRDFSI